MPRALETPVRASDCLREACRQSFKQPRLCCAPHGMRGCPNQLPGSSSVRLCDEHPLFGKSEYIVAGLWCPAKEKWLAGWWYDIPAGVYAKRVTFKNEMPLADRQPLYLHTS